MKLVNNIANSKRLHLRHVGTLASSFPQKKIPLIPSLHVLLVLLASFSIGQMAEPSPHDLDIILVNGRVMDPETGLDEIRNVGISGDTIITITDQSLDSRLNTNGTRIDSTGLVVAPGFIDLHAHGQTDAAIRYRVQDGVTTALELEWGYPEIREWLEVKKGRSRIHYGASVSHGFNRAIVLALMNDPDTASDELMRAAKDMPEPLRVLQNLPFFIATRSSSLSDSETETLNKLMMRGLSEGGLGIGLAHAYYPGASYREIFRIFQFAAQNQAPIFVHVREKGMGAMQEVIANAAATGAPLHIVHANSMSGHELPEVLELIGDARSRGLDITTETYPYTAGSTNINAAIFDDDWQQRLRITYGDLQWQDTGERLTEESFHKYRKIGGTIIAHSMREPMIQLAVSTPFVIIASDAMSYAPFAHPRSAGTFSRILGRYVRDQGALDLMLALRKMTLMPAQRLENIAPMMRLKGRVQEGVDADLVVFDPNTIIDTATFEKGLKESRGIQHVLVSGTQVVRHGELVENEFAGRPILGRYYQPLRK